MELKKPLETRTVQRNRLTKEGRWADYLNLFHELEKTKMSVFERRFELTCLFGPGTLKDGDMRYWDTEAPHSEIEKVRRENKELPPQEIMIKEFGDDPDEDYIEPETKNKDKLYDLSILDDRSCTAEIEMNYVVDNIYSEKLDISKAPSKSAFSYLLWVRESGKNMNTFFSGAYKDFRKKQMDDKKKRQNTLDEDQDLFNTIKRLKVYNKKSAKIVNLTNITSSS